MLVLVNGIPYFAEKMKHDFNEFDAGNRYVFCDTYYSRWARLRFLLLLPFAGAVISVNGVSDRSGSMDWVLRLKKKLIMFWQGTDVQMAVDRTNDDTIFRDYIDYAAHLVVAPWFVEELGQINVKAEYAPYAYVEAFGNDGVYEDVRILTYLAEDAELFYGWEFIREMALKRPDIGVTVVGSKGTGLDAPENVTFKGWVSAETMSDLFRTHAIFVRLTEHDGKAFTVAQALAAGCEVIWTYPFDQCYQLKRESGLLEEKVSELEKEIKARDMHPNVENIRFVEESFQRKGVLTSLLKQINARLNG